MEGEDVKMSSFSEDLWLKKATREEEEALEASKKEKKEEEEEGRSCASTPDVRLSPEEEAAFSIWKSGKQRKNGCY